METLLAQSGLFWLLFIMIGLLSGFVKGAVGFAMPMILISGVASFASPELALATLIIPTVVMNAVQALRGGVMAAIDAARAHWRFIVVGLIGIVSSAQLVTVLPQWGLFLALGIPVTLFAVVQLAGFRLRFDATKKRVAEFGFASAAGLMGGVSGIWGPPTVMYLTALDIPKRESLRVQGVIYGMGAMMLLAAHLKSGIMTAQTLPFSIVMLVPTGIGLAMGIALGNQLDQEKFRRLTLIVLIVAGLNLIRRGLMG